MKCDSFSQSDVLENGLVIDVNLEGDYIIACIGEKHLFSLCNLNSVYFFQQKSQQSA